MVFCIRYSQGQVQLSSNTKKIIQHYYQNKIAATLSQFQRYKIDIMKCEFHIIQYFDTQY